MRLCCGRVRGAEGGGIQAAFQEEGEALTVKRRQLALVLQQL